MYSIAKSSSDAKSTQVFAARLDQYDGLAVGLLITFFLAVFLAFLRPPYLGDQLDYFYHAANPSELGISHRHLRVGIIWPTWLFIQTFGYSELSYYAIPCLAALSFGLGTWLLGRVLFGRWVGATAAILVIFNPWVAADLAHLIPDYFGAGLFTVGVSLIFWLAQTGRLTETPLNQAASITLFISGVLIGWSYLCREFVAILFPLIPLLLLAVRARSSSAVPLAFGALACWVAELSWGWAKYDNPFVRLLGARPRQTERVFATDPIEILAQLPNIFNDRSGGWLFAGLLLLAVIASLVMALKGELRWQIIAAWLIGGWAFFTAVALVPPLLFEDRILLRMQKFRYWAILLPPLFVGGLGALQRMVQMLAYRSRAGVRGRTAIPMVCLACLTLGIALPTWMAMREIWYSEVFTRNGFKDYAEFRSYLKSLDSKKEILVYFGGDHSISSKRSIPLYLNSWHGLSGSWKGKALAFEDLPFIENLDMPASILVAVDRTRLGKDHPVGAGDSDRLRRFLTYLEAEGHIIFSTRLNKIVIYELDTLAARKFANNSSRKS